MEREASCLAEKGFSQWEIDGDGRILSSRGKSIKKKSGYRQNAAWIRLQKQSWLAERIWLWEAQTTLHSLAESTWVAENRNCMATAWAKGLQTWVQRHTHRQHGAEQVLLHVPRSEQCDSGLLFFSWFWFIPFKNDALIWTVFKISSFISATLPPGGYFFPTAVITVVLLRSQITSSEKNPDVNSISRKLELLCTATSSPSDVRYGCAAWRLVSHTLPSSWIICILSLLRFPSKHSIAFLTLPFLLHSTAAGQESPRRPNSNEEPGPMSLCNQ